MPTKISIKISVFFSIIIRTAGILELWGFAFLVSCANGIEVTIRLEQGLALHLFNMGPFTEGSALGSSAGRAKVFRADDSQEPDYILD